VEIRLGVARCLFERGDTAEATKLTDELLAAEPGHAAANRLRGQLAMQAGEFDRAERLFRHALTLAPADLECLNALAGLYGQMGRTADETTFRTAHEKATRDQTELRDTARAVAANPRDANLRYKAGVLMLRNGYTAEGVRWLQSALAEQPTHEPSRQALAEATRSKR
jgi:predicted Zn-dependent protease